MKPKKQAQARDQLEQRVARPFGPVQVSVDAIESSGFGRRCVVVVGFKRIAIQEEPEEEDPDEEPEEESEEDPKDDSKYDPDED